MKTSEADRVLDSNDMLCIAVWFHLVSSETKASDNRQS